MCYVLCIVVVNEYRFNANPYEVHRYGMPIVLAVLLTAGICFAKNELPKSRNISTIHGRINK